MHKSGSFVAALGILLPALLLSLGSPGHTQENLIVSIEVSGNEYISRDAILDAVKNILKIATDYTTEKGTQAKQAIMRMGYFADATVTAEVTPDGTKVMIRVVERKRIEKIAFVGNTVASDSQLTGAILTKVGHVVDNDVIRQDVHRIETFYSRQGYIARVAQARVDDYGVLTFVIDEARLEAFEVKGLKKTKEWVVRRLIETKTRGTVQAGGRGEGHPADLQSRHLPEREVRLAQRSRRPHGGDRGDHRGGEAHGDGLDRGSLQRT